MSPYTVGSILAYSWGYGQTNVEFYEIVSVTKTGKSVRLRRIAAEPLEGSEVHMCDRVAPCPGRYIGDVFTKRSPKLGWIPMPHGVARLIEPGEALHRSWYA